MSASTALSAHVFVNTQICAATSMLMFGVMEIVFDPVGFFSGKPTALGAAIGIVVGLVVITPACGAITPMWAIFFGIVGAFSCYFGLRIPKALGVDPYESLDGFGIHGIGGTIGTLLVGLFASGSSGSNVSGAFYGNPMQLAVQLVGILVTTGMSVVGTTAIFWFLQLVAWGLGDDVRISSLVSSDELDRTEHSSSAYVCFNVIGCSLSFMALCILGIRKDFPLWIKRKPLNCRAKWNWLWKHRRQRVSATHSVPEIWEDHEICTETGDLLTTLRNCKYFC